MSKSWPLLVPDLGKDSSQVPFRPDPPLFRSCLLLSYAMRYAQCDSLYAAGIEPGNGERSPETAKRYPGEANRARQKRSRGLPGSLREREGAHRPRPEVGRGWETEIQLGTTRGIGAGCVFIGIGYWEIGEMKCTQQLKN
jgi:hypothetical protein